MTACISSSLVSVALVRVNGTIRLRCRRVSSSVEDCPRLATDLLLPLPGRGSLFSPCETPIRLDEEVLLSLSSKVVASFDGIVRSYLRNQQEDCVQYGLEVMPKKSSLN